MKFNGILSSSRAGLQKALVKVRKKERVNSLQLTVDRLRKSFYKGRYLLIGVVGLVVLAVGFYYWRSTGITENAEISEVNGSYQNSNPNFSVQFEEDTVRFETQPSKENPFEDVDTEKTLWERVKNSFQGNQNLGVEMSVVEASFSGVGEVLGDVNEDSFLDIEAGGDIELMELGRTFSDYEGEIENDDEVTKDTVIMEDVVDNVDIEYQIIEGIGLKEEILLKWSDDYDSECMDNEDSSCNLPPNTFKFNLVLDDGVELKRSMTSVNNNPKDTYYFSDNEGNYIAHFLPSFAEDKTGSKTNNVRLTIDETEEHNKYEITVTLDYEWLLSEDRLFPIRIDPSIIHDTEAEFDLGETINRMEVTSDPKVQMIDQEFTADAYTLGLWHMEELVLDGTYRTHNYIGTDRYIYSWDLDGDEAVAGKFGNGLLLNGTDEFLSNNTSSSYFMWDNDFTVEAWFKHSTISAIDYLFADFNNYGWKIWMDASGDMCFGIDNDATWTPDDSACTSGIDYDDDEWHYLAAVKKGESYISLYIDGVKVAEDLAIAATGVVHYATFYIGTNRLTNGSYWAGMVDEVRISSVARSSEEIAINAGLPWYGTYISNQIDLSAPSSIDDLQWSEDTVRSGDGETPSSSTNLVAQWNFNETSGTSLNNDAEGSSCDGAPSSCDGTLVNFATTTGQDDAQLTGWTSDNRRWGTGALMFDGTGDRVDITKDEPFMIQDFTIEAWIKPNDYSSNGTIFSCRNASEYYGYGLRLNDTGYIRFFTATTTGGTRDDVITTQMIDLNKWTHVVATIEEGVAMKVYMNGKLVGSDTSTLSVLYDATHYPTMGNNAGRTTYFDGVLDVTKFYSRVLTQSEIAENYNKTDIEFMTRSSSDGSTWEAWKPTSGETQLDNLDYAYSEVSTTNMLSYWPMDETVDNSCSGGEDVCDRNGSSHGTDVGSSTIEDGYFGNSRDFNGSSQSVSLPSTASSQLNTKGSASVSAWIKRDTTLNVDRIFDLSVTGTSPKLRLDFRSDDKIRCGAQPTSTDSWCSEATDTATVTDTDWHQVVCVTDIANDDVYIYLDGVLQASTGTVAWTATSFNSDVGSAQSIGVDSLGSNYHDGNIDEVALYGFALTAGQVEKNYFVGSDNRSSVSFKHDQDFYREGDGSLMVKSGYSLVGEHTIGLWHLDETNGDNASDDVFDETSNNNDGEFYGTNIASGVVDGFYGKARTFNGSDDYIDFGDIADIDTATDLTGCAWVKHDDFLNSNDEFIMAKSNGTTDGFMLYRDNIGITRDDTYTIFFADSGDADSVYVEGRADAFKEGAWTHVCFTYDQGSSTGLRLYINGEEDPNGPANTTSIGGIDAGSNSFIIGTDGATADFDGVMDEVFITEEILSSNDIYEIYRAGRDHRFFTSTTTATDVSSSTRLPFWVAADRPGSYLEATIGQSGYSNNIPDNDTVGYWRMEEEFGSGAYVKDYSTYGHDATPTGTVYTKGKVGNAHAVDGSASYLTVAHHTDYNITSAITLEAWINPDTIEGAGSWDRIIEKGANNQYSLSVTTASGYGLVARFYGTTTVTTYSNFIPETDVWSHVAVVYNGTKVKFYVNGVLVKEGSNSGSITTTTNDLVIGDWTTHTRGFDGIIDEVRISNVSRTASRIRESYEAGLRTHPVTIDFAASLDSGGTGALITSSSDDLFSIDATDYGLSEEGSGLYHGDYVIVKEVDDDTTYIAQGEVKSCVASTGEVEVYDWDTSSTFPTGGFTANASVFKWQREYFDITEALDEHIDAVDHLTFRITDGNGGRNIWIDDVNKAGYLTNSTATSNIDSTAQRYFEYMGIFTSRDGVNSPYISSATVNYTAGGPTNDLLMRHGMWFSGQTKQSFWWGP